MRITKSYLLKKIDLLEAELGRCQTHLFNASMMLAETKNPNLSQMEERISNLEKEVFRK